MCIFIGQSLRHMLRIPNQRLSRQKVLVELEVADFKKAEDGQTKTPHHSMKSSLD